MQDICFCLVLLHYTWLPNIRAWHSEIGTTPNTEVHCKRYGYLFCYTQFGVRTPSDHQRETTRIPIMVSVHHHPYCHIKPQHQTLPPPALNPALEFVSGIRDQQYAPLYALLLLHLVDFLQIEPQSSIFACFDSLSTTGCFLHYTQLHLPICAPCICYSSTSGRIDMAVLSRHLVFMVLWSQRALRTRPP